MAPERDAMATSKTLPPALSRDPLLLARFRREARILASLNHLNIPRLPQD